MSKSGPKLPEFNKNLCKSYHQLIKTIFLNALKIFLIAFSIMVYTDYGNNFMEISLFL